MITIIAGSRDIHDLGLVAEAMLAAHLVCGITPTRVRSGGAAGVDKLGEQWAGGHRIPLDIYPADWKTHGKSAGYKRNVEMAIGRNGQPPAEALVAVWRNRSRGTGHMIDIARERGLNVCVWEV